MSGPLVGLLGFAGVLLLIFLRMPVAIAMGVGGAIGYAYLNGLDSLGFIMGRVVFDSAFPYTLSVLPLFILMGAFSGHAGLSRSLYECVSSFVGHLRGGLALATIGACAVFGAICGSAIATAATMGRVALPEMRRRGYSDSLSTASIAAGGTLGVMIPPSVLFVIYGLMTELSIGKLLASGVLPGILGTLLYMGAVRWSVMRRPDSGPAGAKTSWPQRLNALREIWQVVALFSLVLGGMYFGWFSPTEAAAIGAFGALLLAWISGRLNRGTLANASRETALTTGMIFMILIGAGLFNYFIEGTGLTDAIIDRARETGWNRWTIMALLMIFYIILGALMDELSMILLTVGPVFKLVLHLGFDPIWFGVMLVTVCEIGMIAPPVGINLFVLQSIGQTKLATIVRGIAPFIVADCIRLVLLSLFPELATWLPDSMQ